MPRKSKNLPYRKIIAIYCEGASEAQYFEMLKTKYHRSNVHIHHSSKVTITSVGLSGMPLLEKVKRKVSHLPKNQQAEKAYVVFDRDQLSPESIKKCQVFAANNDISIIFSNVNLEIWILMHFINVTKPYTAQELYTILSGPQYFNTNYQHFKGKSYDNILADRIKTAMTHADSLQKKYNGCWYLNNPCTNMNTAIPEIFNVTEF